LEINLYFDPQTYRHVETTYSYSTTASLTGTNPLAATTDSPAAGVRADPQVLVLRAEARKLPKLDWFRIVFA